MPDHHNPAEFQSLESYICHIFISHFLKHVIGAIIKETDKTIRGHVRLNDNFKIPGMRSSRSRRVSICRIGDLFDFLCQLELRFEDYYKAVRKKSPDNNAKLLSYYLACHHKRFLAELDEYGTARIKTLMKRKIQQEIIILTDEWLTLLAVPPARITGSNLLESAIAFNRKLTDIYKNMLSQKLPANVMAMLRKLNKFEENEAERFQKMLAMNYFL